MERPENGAFFFIAKIISKNEKIGLTNSI